MAENVATTCCKNIFWGKPPPRWERSCVHFWLPALRALVAPPLFDPCGPPGPGTWLEARSQPRTTGLLEAPPHLSSAACKPLADPFCVPCRATPQICVLGVLA